MNKGFTLVEMLCTIVIILLISALVVTGVQLGVRSYHRSVSDSEAQVLCSTLTTAISDELRYAGTVHLTGGTRTTYDMTQFSFSASVTETMRPLPSTPTARSCSPATSSSPPRPTPMGPGPDWPSNMTRRNTALP